MDPLDPDSSRTALLLSGVLYLLLFAGASAAEAMIRSARRYEVRKLIEGQVAGSLSLQRLITAPERRRATLMAVRLVGAVGAALSAGALATRGGISVPAALAGLVVALLLVDQVAFVVVSGRVSAHTAAKVAILVEGARIVMTPLLFPLELVSRRLARPTPQEDGTGGGLSDEELRVLASVVGEEDAADDLPPREREMIARIFELHETTVREIMVPRLDIVALPADASLEQALNTIVEYGYSRIPVYEGTIDHIIGALYAKDMLSALRDGNLEEPIRRRRESLVRSVLFVPESKKLDELLQELQRHRIHLAIVVDEYGGTAGIATIEDILEEIVGEIWDEYDRDLDRDQSFLRVGPHEVLCSGRMDLDDLNRLLDLDLPTDRSDTVGGLIYSELGRVPRVGEEVAVDGARFRVEAVSGRRIVRVRVIRWPSDEDAHELGASPEEERTHLDASGRAGSAAPAPEERAGSEVQP